MKVKFLIRDWKEDVSVKKLIIALCEVFEDYQRRNVPSIHELVPVCDNRYTVIASEMITPEEAQRIFDVFEERECGADDSGVDTNATDFVTPFERAMEIAISSSGTISLAGSDKEE